MNYENLKPGDEFQWNGIDCVVVHPPYESSVLCMRKGTTSGKFGVPVGDFNQRDCEVCRGSGIHPLQAGVPPGDVMACSFCCGEKTYNLISKIL